MIGREAITCLDCGERSVRSRRYAGNYCENCRPAPPNGGPDDRD